FWHNAKKYLLWEVSVVKNNIHAQAGTVISTAPLIIAAGQDAVKVEFGQPECGIYCSGAQLTIEADFVVNVDISNHKKTAGREYKKVLIIGANGFIGNAISERLLAEGKYDIYAIDLRSDGISHLLNHPDFHYFEGDIRLNHEWMEHHIRMCDIILPLAAIAVPMEYIRNP
ncbi:MAG: NAD-dependent epimerase/dehydratase family protein, partial [Victivallaceae bacterium]